MNFFWAFVVALASIRGVLVMHFGFEPNKVYSMTSLLLLLFGFFSLLTFNKKFPEQLGVLRKAVIVNAICISFYSLIGMVIDFKESFASLYQWLIFYSVFSFLRFKDELLHLVVLVVALVTGFGIYYFYQIGAVGGFVAIAEANMRLRPDNLMYSRIGENLLPAGYQGDHHDAAAIMVICALHYLVRLLIVDGFMKRVLHMVVFLFLTFAALLTGSAANIVVLLVMCMVAIILYFLQSRISLGRLFLMLLLVFVFLFPLFFVEDFERYLYFVNKLTYDQSAMEGGGIYNSFGFEPFVMSLPSLLFGFGYALHVPMTSSEVAFVKIIVAYGVVPSAVLFFICFSPLYYINKFVGHYSDKVSVGKAGFADCEASVMMGDKYRSVDYYRIRLLIESLPVLGGTLTLLHYGSVFRITTVALFCVELALFYKSYLSVLEFFEVRDRHGI